MATNAWDRLGYVAGRLALTGSLLALAHCGTTGDLGHGEFLYECVDATTDAACTGSLFDESRGAEDPWPVARTGRARVWYRPYSTYWNGSSSSSDDVPAKPEASSPFVADEGDALSFDAAGIAALFAREGNVVKDFMHVRVEPVADISVAKTVGWWSHTDLGDEVALDVGTSMCVLATPLAADGVELIGSLDVAWHSSDDAVATVAGAEAEVLITAVSVGTALVTVFAGDASASLVVTVEEQVSP